MLGGRPGFGEPTVLPILALAVRGHGLRGGSTGWEDSGRGVLKINLKSVQSNYINSINSMQVSTLSYRYFERETVNYFLFRSNLLVVWLVGWEGVAAASPRVAWLEPVAVSLQLGVSLVLVACLSPYLFQLPLVFVSPFLPHFLSLCLPLAQDVVAPDGFEE